MEQLREHLGYALMAKGQVRPWAFVLPIERDGRPIIHVFQHPMALFREFRPDLPISQFSSRFELPGITIRPIGRGNISDKPTLVEVHSLSVGSALAVIFSGVKISLNGRMAKQVNEGLPIAVEIFHRHNVNHPQVRSIHPIPDDEVQVVSISQRQDIKLMDIPDIIDGYIAIFKMEEKRLAEMQ